MFSQALGFSSVRTTCSAPPSAIVWKIHHRGMSLLAGRQDTNCLPCFSEPLTHSSPLVSAVSVEIHGRQAGLAPSWCHSRSISTSNSLAHAPGSASTAGGAPSSRSIDPLEQAKFAALSSQWWDTSGPFAPLHRMNRTRCEFLRDSVCSQRSIPRETMKPLSGLTAIDVGCGGGLLSESVTRLGAQVQGIDISYENVAAARLHALGSGDPQIISRLSYKCISAEDCAAEGSQYDIVMASEVIEHVKSPADFVATLTKLLKPDGLLLLSTLNRTPASFALAIVGAEYVFGLVPVGTHNWDRFITPEELSSMTRLCGLHVTHMAGMCRSNLTGAWSLGEDLSVNFIAALRLGHVPKP